MRTFKSLTIVTFIIITVLSEYAISQEMLTRLLVKVSDNIQAITPVRGADGIWRSNIPSIDALNMQFGCNRIRKFYRGTHPRGKGLYIFSFPENSDMVNIANSYAQDVNIVSTQIDYLVPVGQTRNEPDDNLFLSELGLEQMDAPEGWDIETGSASVIIQILDTGVDFAHPDLGPNMWQNLGEDFDGDGVVLIYDSSNDEWIFDPGDENGVDDDGNGYIDDFVGWDFWWEDNDPIHSQNNSTHGTQVASTVAEVGNNGIGGVGVSWNSSIMAAKIGVGDGINTLQAAEAILYAIENGANILNMSFGFSATPAYLDTVLLDAWDAGILPVAAAMHTIPGPGTDDPKYPGAWDQVISVSALNLDDTKLDIAQFGTWVNISAPRYDCTAKFDRLGTPKHIYVRVWSYLNLKSICCGFGCSNLV